MPRILRYFVPKMVDCDICGYACHVLTIAIKDSMIQVQSNLQVADNSGARRVQCIRILKKSKAISAGVGDIITVVVKKARPHKRVQRKDIRTAIIVRVKKDINRKDGFKLNLGENSCMLVNSAKDLTPLGTRLNGPVAIRELRKAKAIKCILLSNYNY